MNSSFWHTWDNQFFLTSAKHLSNLLHNRTPQKPHWQKCSIQASWRLVIWWIGALTGFVRCKIISFSHETSDRWVVPHLIVFNEGIYRHATSICRNFHQSLEQTSGPSIKMQRGTVKGLSLVFEIPILDHHFVLGPSYRTKFLKAIKVDQDFPMQGPKFDRKIIDVLENCFDHISK